ncbi:T9SS type A sorting domain-containing protein [uncultured Lacinutrix sp.]|uniref:DUF6923 family protein n=1 Tax=uncultured Lacinutrix sp. TaxID=574032 RepID=UPI002630FA12|nr:T9SS type A sorting domain-containing protein [uncultured Lacinutrix sp.]
MDQKFYSYKNQFILIVILFFNFNSQAQIFPFYCDYDAYLFQYNDLYSIDLASGNFYLMASDITPGNINAAAYNPVDGYIWGSLSTPEKTIVRIGQDFNTTTFYIDELPNSNRYIGDISAQGVYYLKGGGTTYYKVDLNPTSPTYSQHLATEDLSQNLSIHDWAFNAVDGNLYAVEKTYNILYRIDPSNGVVLTLGEVPVLSGLNYTYGAVYFDASGRFYVSANQTGTIYVIQNVQDVDGTNGMDSSLFAFGPSSASNDGARCPTAPVPQEVCDNGIDDDGDGLIDCEDPSCSTFGDCAVVEAPTSSANAGGLESNNRLSDKINKRSYNRAKTSYKFNKETAKRVVKTANYAQRNGFTGFQLEDFIPLSVINEDYVVESTATDLLNITNATEIYSVDYINNDTSVASILALKTEDGVYEHTKYICDRLLGAQLISVSTIDINGQSFIKSLIKNADNTIEFVLSLSAKVVNDDANFAIESHWNLDRYEDDVTFYNFQIWSNSLDDLYLLAEEVVNLLNIEKPISDYNNSTPPTVFVRKGKYINGELDLQIVNTNGTQDVTLDAGLRVTETSDINTISSSIALNGYITDLEVQTGNLFDVGFRIGDGIATPDDLFMSDGPWGIDDAQPTTVVNNYEVLPNTNSFETTDFPIERNVNLEATTSTYFAAYRALTPRFKAVDLTDYNSFNLKAKGTGNLLITFVKQSITNWELQHKTTIALADNFQDFNIPFSDFTAPNGQELVLDDVVTIVFTMASEDGSLVTKTMHLQDVRFSNTNTLAVDTFEKETTRLAIIPNPMSANTTVYFNANASTNVTLVVYDQLGKQVKQVDYKTVKGINEIQLNKGKLSTGLYFCKIVSQEQDYKILKLMIR